jgi:hypothetical protein
MLTTRRSSEQTIDRPSPGATWLTLLGIQSQSLTLVKVVALTLVGACAAAAPVRDARSPHATQADAEAVLEGTMEVLIEDSDQGSRMLYFLISGDRRVALRFLSRPLNLTTGTRVRVRGRWEENTTLVVTAIERI